MTPDAWYMPAQYDHPVVGGNRPADPLSEAELKKRAALLEENKRVLVDWSRPQEIDLKAEQELRAADEAVEADRLKRAETAYVKQFLPNLERVELQFENAALKTRLARLEFRRGKLSWWRKLLLKVAGWAY